MSRRSRSERRAARAGERAEGASPGERGSTHEGRPGERPLALPESPPAEPPLIEAPAATPRAGGAPPPAERAVGTEGFTDWSFLKRSAFARSISACFATLARFERAGGAGAGAAALRVAAPPAPGAEG
jgi:hypothetical protein